MFAVCLEDTSTLNTKYEYKRIYTNLHWCNIATYLVRMIGVIKRIPILNWCLSRAIPPDSSKEICYGDLVTEILYERHVPKK